LRRSAGDARGVRPLCVSMKTSTLTLEVLLASAGLVFGLVPISQARFLQEPTVKSTELPSYPPLARAACIQGSVAVVVEMGQDGQVTGTDILYGHPLLRSAAETAARKWRFEAAANGARREVLRFTFRILPFETPAKRVKATFTRATDVEIRSYPYEPSCDDCSPKRLKQLRKGGCPPVSRGQ